MRKGRKILVMLLALFTWMGTTVRAEDAADATVTFDGSRTLQYSGFEEEGFDSAFRGMLPGEERTLKIRLRNTSDRAVDFFMDTQILKSLQEAADNAAYYVKLEVLQDGASTVILGSGEEAAVIGGTSSDGTAAAGNQGLKELNDTWNGYRMVASLTQGGTAEILLDIQLDGETGDNSYQNQIGVMQFQFQASYNEPEVQTVSRTRKGDTQVRVQVAGQQQDGQAQGLLMRAAGAQTGDDAPIAALIAVICAASAALTGILVLFLRRRKQEQAG